MSDRVGYTHRAIVLAVGDDGITLEIPSLAAAASWGPIPTAVPDLAPGEAVLVSQVGTSRDTLIVTQRVPGRAPTTGEIPGLDSVIAALQAADTALGGRVTTTESDIALGLSEITANTASIATNTANIATNTTAITANGTAITANATATTALGVRVTALEALRQHGVNVVTLVSTGSLVYVPLGSDDVSITMPYPASGIATVTVACTVACSVVGIYGLMTFEIRDTNASGTVRKSAVDDNAAFNLCGAPSTALGIVGAASPISGLPTSGTMFLRAMYRSNDASNTAAFGYRRISVMPSP